MKPRITLPILVLLNDNPLEDISNVRKVHTVVLKGKLLDRSALDSMVEEVRGKVAAYNNRNRETTR